MRMPWPLRRKVSTAPAGDTAVETFSFGGTLSPWLRGGTYVGTGGYLAARATRAEAMSVAAVKRGRDLLTAIGALGLHELGADNTRIDRSFLDQIDPSVANVVTLAMTIDDLLFESMSFWRITDYAPDGRPRHARHLDFDAVSQTPPPGFPIHTLPSGYAVDGSVWVMGEHIPGKDIIRFDSPNTPLLDCAAVIRRAVLLASAGEMYARDPEARAQWSATDGFDPSIEDRREAMAEYAEARRRGAEAWIPAFAHREVIKGATPVDLQLVDLQRRSDLEIANILGIDPEDIGVSTTSRTYANAVDRRIDRVNGTYAPYMRAITDRLSMNDITTRGRRVEFDLSQYMRADPATRWSTYATAIDKGVLSVAEVRQREDLPAIPVEPAISSPAVSRKTEQQKMTSVESFSAAADAGEYTVSFRRAEFAADKETRRVSGTLVPFGVASEDSRAVTFAKGSVAWNSAAVSSVKLDREHDSSILLGAAVDIRSVDGGLWGEFKIARTPAGDEALSLAADGVLDAFSVVVAVDEVAEDSDDGHGPVVTAARLRRVTLTADPAFSGARIDHVAATAVRDTEGSTDMGAEITGVAELTAALTSATEGFTAAVEALNGTAPPEQVGRLAPRAAAASVREPMVYTLDGLGDSFTRDAWTARQAQPGSKEQDEAFARLRKYQEQTAELAAGQVAQFANAGNTTDQADIIPPGYRPDLYVGQIPQGRPLFDSVGTRVKLANATAFKVPIWVGSAGLSGTNTEGTGPSTGTITDHDYVTVTPTAQSGEFVVTRELMDSSNPAIDRIAMAAMQEEYKADTEAIIAAAIAAATDDGSPVDGTPDTSTEGCHVYTLTGSGNDLYIEGLRDMEADYVGNRHLTPDRLLASPTGFKALSKAIDDSGRPLFPYVGAMNAGGQIGRVGQSLSVDGLAVPNTWTMTSTYNDLLLFNSVDMLAGESPLLTFKFFEKGGPENVYLNLWGYFAFQILRYGGIHSMNYTAA